MIYTFGNTQDQFAPFVDTGRCVGDVTILTRVNEAISRLMLCDNWKLTIQKMTFKVTHNSIILPQFVESIVAFRTCCGIPGNVWNQFYEFSESGPGETTWNGNPGRDLVDLGTFPFFHPIEINSSLSLCAFSPAIADTTKTIHIRGISAGREVMTGAELGIELGINRWQKGIEGTIQYDNMVSSEATFSEATHLVKPVTAGHITLIAMNKTTKQMQILGVYQPWETVPGFRRYKVVNHDHENGTTIVAACKMRYTPMRHANDPLIIQNPPAVIAMLQAMHAEKSNNVQAQISYENKAMQWLQRQSVQLDDQKAGLSVTVRDWGMGDAVQFH